MKIVVFFFVSFMIITLIDPTHAIVDDKYTQDSCLSCLFCSPTKPNCCARCAVCTACCSSCVYKATNFDAHARLMGQLPSSDAVRRNDADESKENILNKMQ